MNPDIRRSILGQPRSASVEESLNVIVLPRAINSFSWGTPMGTV